MSSSNPFASFSAGNDGGWLQTKRIGKDDSQIKKDKERALEARKAARNKNRTKPPPKQKKPPQKKKRKRKSNVYDSEDEDLSDFVVDDDEEIEEEFSSNSESEVEAMVPMKRKAKTKSKTNKKPQIFEIQSSDDDDDEIEDSIFGGTLAKRPTAAATNGQQKRRGALLDASNRRYSEEKKQEDMSSSDDSELEIVGDTTSSHHFATEQSSAAVARKPASLDNSSDDSDSDTAAFASFKPKKMKKLPKTMLDDDSSDDDIPTRSYGSTGFSAGDFVDNDDEVDAMLLAVAESTPRPKHERKRLKKKKKKKKKRQVTVDLSSEGTPGSSRADAFDEQELLEESSSGGEDEQDAYVDKSAAEAVSVLKAANELSAKVIQAMTGWSAEKDGESVPTGIIVDGALSLVSSDKSQTSSHSWISHEIMKNVCPQVTLADYQLIGVNWLALLHELKVDLDGKKGGTNVNGVLADEMGLGKTVQTITFLAWLRYHNREKYGYNEPEVIELDGDSETAANEISLLDDNDAEPPTNNDRPQARPHLIVVPASTLTNWEREFEKFCPDMHVVKYHGSMVEREDLRAELRKYLPSKNGVTKQHAHPVDVVLTTFSYFSGEKADDRSFLKKFQFDYMVVDEAHCLKNSKGQRYRNLDRFDTSHRLLLTGTPVQNSPKELMSLLSFLMPLFSPASKDNSFDFGDDTKNDGGESMLQHFVSIEGSDLSNGDASEAAYRKLKQLFAPFVLRRRKVDALKQLMPEKTRRVEWVPFDEATRTVYDSVLAAHINKKENGSSSSAQQHLFTALRKAANHPLLLRTRHTSEEAKNHLAKHLFQFGYFGRDETCTVDHVRRQLETFSDFDVHCAALDLIAEKKFREGELGRYTLKQEDLFSSPKFERLRVLLPELIEKGHRILIFSQWKICLDLLGCLMESLNLEFLRLDGSTKISERQVLIDTFNEDSSIPVFLLSTRAGGMGINLTAADVCILHDLDFNPFNDIQAEDRCHRIGQTKPVSIIKMVTENTVDADIYRMQQRKAKMNAAILESDGSETAKQNKEEEAAKQSIVQSAVNRFVHNSPLPKGCKEDDDEEMDV